MTNGQIDYHVNMSSTEQLKAMLAGELPVEARAAFERELALRSKATVSSILASWAAPAPRRGRR
jgi:hypothetical protein